jgi:hypothetical protein
MGMSTVGVRPVGVRTGAVAPRTMSRFERSNRTFVTSGRFHRDRDRFFGRNCFGDFRCRDRFFLNSGLLFPFGSSYIDPFYGDYYSQPEPQVVGSDGNSTNMQLALEVQRLSDEIEEMRDQDRRTAAPRAQVQYGTISAQPPAESTAFIFRDGHRITTQNYAIVGETLWVLGEHTAKKVSLANLDKAATEQANAANGIELHLP